MIGIVALLIGWMALGAVVDAAEVATENFDTYSDGDLDTQNGGTGWSAAWTGHSAYDVQGSQFVSSPKAASETGAEAGIDREFDPQTGITTITVQHRRSNTTNNAGINFYSGSTLIGWFLTETTGTRWNCNSSTDGTWTSGTWYEMQITIDPSTDTLTCEVDGVALIEDVAFINNVDNVSKIRLYTEGAGVSYWDDLAIQNDETGVGGDPGATASSTVSETVEIATLQANTLRDGMFLFLGAFAFMAFYFRKV